LSISFPDGGPARLQQVLLDQSSVQSDMKAAERIADVSGSVSEQFIYGKLNAGFLPETLCQLYFSDKLLDEPFA
jgi:hypothetical protein